MIGFNHIDGYHSWSLGRTISTSLQLPLRILSANILRELLLAAIDLRLFWPAELHDSNDIQLNASFIADTEWLETTVEHLHHIDIRHAAPEERYCLPLYGSYSMKTY